MIEGCGEARRAGLTTSECGDKWKADKRDVASWCKNGFIPGAKKEEKFPFSWIIPLDAKRPIDFAIVHELLWQILELKNGNITRIDVTGWGIPGCHVDGCIQSLVDADYLAIFQDSKELRLTGKAFEALGRCSSNRAATGRREVLIWAAGATGAFMGGFVKGLIN